MSQMALQHGAINLSQGFPNFGIDPVLEAIVAKIVTDNVHQYMPSAGYPPLLEKIAALVFRSYGRHVEPAAEILVTAGATQAIFATIQAIVSPGDEVIILDPAYDCYDMPVRLRCGKAVHVPLSDDFSPDWAAIAAATNDKTKLVILNNPHNPSGKIWRETDFMTLETLLERYPDIVVLADEVYEFISFMPHISVNARPRLSHRSIVVSSFGKSFHITGWKVGYAIGPETLLDRIKKIHQFLVFSVNGVAQAAIAAYLDTANVTLLAEFYRKKRDYFSSLLSQSRFTLLPCEGTYFQTASYRDIGNDDDLSFTKSMTLEHKVAAIPLSVFYENGKDLRHIRFCFAKDDATLEAAAERLSKI
jgi:methionine aminotransferase